MSTNNNAERTEKRNGSEVVRRMVSRKESLRNLGRTFGIPLAEKREQGVKVLLYYKRGERLYSSYNGGAFLKDEYPWEMVSPIARYVILRGAKEMFGIKLLHTEEGYKLEEFVFE